MMTVLTRQQFRQHWNGIYPGIAKDGGPMWAYEVDCKKKSRWFVCVRPLNTAFESIADGGDRKQEYWLWCNWHCAGQIICYVSNSDEQEEWWGFSHRADIVLWMLKWSQ